MTTPLTVSSWLTALTLEQYEPNFIQHGYNTIEKCASLEKNDLNNMGIVLPGHVKRILKNIDIIKQMSHLSRKSNNSFNSTSSIDSSSSEGFHEDSNTYVFPRSYQPASIYYNEDSVPSLPSKANISIDDKLGLSDRTLNNKEAAKPSSSMTPTEQCISPQDSHSKTLSNRTDFKPLPAPRNQFKKNSSVESFDNRSITSMNSFEESRKINSTNTSNSINLNEATKIEDEYFLSTSSNQNNPVMSPDSGCRLLSENSIYETVIMDYDVINDNQDTNYLQMNKGNISNRSQDVNFNKKPNSLTSSNIMNKPFLFNKSNDILNEKSIGKDCVIYEDIEKDIYLNIQPQSRIVESVEGFNQPLYTTTDLAVLDNWINEDPTVNTNSLPVRSPKVQNWAEKTNAKKVSSPLSPEINLNLIISHLSKLEEDDDEDGEDVLSNRSSIPPPSFSPPPRPSNVSTPTHPAIPPRLGAVAEINSKTNNFFADDIVDIKPTDKTNREVQSKEKDSYTVLLTQQSKSSDVWKKIDDEDKDVGDYLVPNMTTTESAPINPIRVAPKLPVISPTFGRKETNSSTFYDVNSKPQNISIQLQVSQGKELIENGFLKRYDNRSKSDQVLKWAVIEDNLLTIYEADKTTENTKMEFKDIRSISLIPTESLEYPFEITFKSGRTRMVLVADSFIARGSWVDSIAQKLAKSLVNKKEISKICDIQLCGFVILKLKNLNQSMDRQITGWMHIQDRILFIYGENNCFEEYDLRKLKNIQYGGGTGESNRQSQDESSSLSLLFYQTILAIEGTSPAETNYWFTSISKNIMTFNRNRISEQFVTSDNIPIFVDKCILFIKTNGFRAEGIYRLSGQTSKVTKLYDQLSQDARSVMLSVGDYTVHEVANALKRFFRYLEDPLFTRQLYQACIIVPSINSHANKIKAYKEILEQLPVVNYATLRYLILHLVRVSNYKEENKMGVINLASIFGPILLSTNNNDNSQYAAASNEISVVKDLLDDYNEIFEVGEEEADRNRKMEEAMRKIDILNQHQQLSTNDSTIFEKGILIGIHMGDNSSEDIVNFTLSSSMIAGDLVKILLDNDKYSTSSSWSLFEVICNEELERPIDNKENMLNLVLKYKTWPKVFCQKMKIVFKDNIYHNSLLLMMDTSVHPLYSELKIAIQKTFKKYSFEFIKCMLSFRKDAKSVITESSWRSEDIVVYFGVPANRRSSNAEYGFTFYDINVPLNSQYFGWSISCLNEEERFRWVAAILKTQHPETYKGLPNMNFGESNIRHTRAPSLTNLAPSLANAKNKLFGKIGRK